MVQRVIPNCLNGIKHGDSSATEHVQVHAELARHHLGKGQSLMEQSPRTSNQLLHEKHIALIELLFEDFVLTKPISLGAIQRNVNAPFFEVTRNVLPEICKLQSRAGRVR